MQIYSDPSLIRHHASLPHSQDNLMVQVPANPPPLSHHGHLGGPEPSLQSLASWGPFEDPLPLAQPGKEVHSHLPPLTPGPEGSPLDHTRFQLGIQLLEKENALHLPLLPVQLPRLEREKLFLKEEGSLQIDHYSHDSFETKDAWGRAPEVHTPVSPPKPDGRDC